MNPGKGKKGLPVIPRFAGLSKEISSVLVGQHKGRVWFGRLHRVKPGRTASVEVDWAWALDHEEQKGDVLGFYHSHPGGSASLSERDVRTMRAWVSCFGKSLLCLVEGKSGLAAYRFDTDESNGTLLREAERFKRNVIVVFDE